jgi:hypothetical protein
MIKESYRVQKQPLVNVLKEKSKQLAVFFIFTGNELPKQADVHEKINAAIKRLMKIVDEAAPSNS